AIANWPACLIGHRTLCMHKPVTIGVEDVVTMASAPESSQHFDAIVIGAGLGGLLSAAHLLARGKRVIVLERLPHCGGRFTAKTYQGVQISTGAVHMVPFGSRGVLAGMLRRLSIRHHFFNADVFAS